VVAVRGTRTKELAGVGAAGAWTETAGGGSG